MNRLAMYGGVPVRKKSFPPKALGASLIGAEELRELRDVVASQSPFRHYGANVPEKTKTFEEEARQFLNCRYALAVSSGTAALCCALAALDIGVNDEVILPAFAWYSDCYSVIHAGALPVYAEIDDSLNLDPQDFERKITKRTKGVIVIHYQGGSARMNEILNIAKKHNIKVIEDCAQAFGGNYFERKVGNLGDIGITSFQGNKVITCGEGGLLYTNDENYFVKAVRYHDLGFVRPVFFGQLSAENLPDGDAEGNFPGLQYRMSELQGAFILAQLRKLPGLLHQCRKHHQRIKDYFSKCTHFSFRSAEGGDCGITVFIKFASCEEATTFADALAAEGIPMGPSSSCSNLLESPAIRNKAMLRNDMPPFGKGYMGEHVEYDPKTCCPNTNIILSCYISIGIGPAYTDEDIDDIIAAIEKVRYVLYESSGEK